MSSWTIIADCIKKNGSYVKLYRKYCNNGIENEYCRGITKSEKCQPRDEAPLTISNVAKAQGKVTLLELKVNNTLIVDKVLEIILIEKGNSYAQLKRETENGLFALFQSNNVEVKFIHCNRIESWKFDCGLHCRI